MIFDSPGNYEGLATPLPVYDDKDSQKIFKTSSDTALGFDFPYLLV